MRSEALALASVVAMLLPAATTALVLPQPPVPAFDVGFSPSLLFPASGGTPVFAPGDHLWVLSHLNTTAWVEVASVTPNATIHIGPAIPGVPVDLMQFGSSDPQGLWTVSVPGTAYSPVAFLVSGVGSSPVNMTLVGHSVSKGSLVVNLTTSSAQPLYDEQACVLGGTDDSGARLAVPQVDGSGDVILSRYGDVVDVGGEGLGRSNFSLSLQLYYSFSFLLPGSSTELVSRSIEVASAGGVLVSSGGILPTLTLQHDSQLRPGRYQLRAFFEGTGGLSLSSTDVLLQGGGTWEWLGGCVSAPVYSASFGLGIPLGDQPLEWPRNVILTYTSFGVQGSAQLPLGFNISEVAFVGVPWGVRLTNYQVAMNVSSGSAEVYAYNGTAYLILRSPRASIHYGVGLEGQEFYTGEVGPVAPFTTTTVPLNVSRISATYFVNGAPFGGGTVRVSDPSGELASSPTDPRGRVVFYVPAGSYVLNATGGNSTAVQAVAVGVGQAADVVLGEQPQSAPDPITVVGVVAAAGGAVANIVLFARRRRERRYPSGNVRRPSQK